MEAAEDDCGLRNIASHHQENVFTVAFSPDEQALATGGGETTVRLCDMRSCLVIAAGDININVNATHMIT
jgi:WD40 repeat protein